MANFGPDATRLNDPNLGSASHVTPGVEDRSGAIRAGAVSDLIKMAAPQVVEAVKAYEIDKINVATQDEIQQYMTRRQNPEMAKDALAGAAAQDVQTSVFKLEGAELSAVEKAQKDRLNTYQKALAEGVMSPEEFHTRVLANLRETVNKNPGLYNELKSEAARVLELSGITGVLQVDKTIAESRSKAEEKAFDDMRERAKREHIYYDSSTPMWLLAKKVQEAENDTRAYDLQIRNKERFNMATAEQALEWVDQVGDNVVRGSLGNTSTTLLQMVDEQGIDSSTYPRFKAQVEATLDNQHQIFVGSIPASIRQNPNVQELIRNHAEGVEKLKTRMSGLASGDDLKKAITNEVDILKGVQDRNLRKTYNVSELDLMSNMMRNIPGVILEGDVRKKYSGIIQNIASGNYKAPVMEELTPKSDQDKTSGIIVQSALSQGEKTGNWQPLGRTLEAMNNHGPNIGTPKQRLQFLYNNISAIAKTGPMQMDAYSLNQVETAVGQMLKDTNFGVNTLIETTKGLKVSMDILPSGMLVFNGADAAKFNRVYGSNVNVALQAYANAHNTTIKEAAKTFYPKYFSDLVKVEDK